MGLWCGGVRGPVQLALFMVGLALPHEMCGRGGGFRQAMTMSSPLPWTQAGARPLGSVLVSGLSPPYANGLAAAGLGTGSRVLLSWESNAPVAGLYQRESML